MEYDIDQIAKVVNGQLLSKGDRSVLHNVVFDTRKISYAQGSIFFAFITATNDGHLYLEDAYEKGIRNFIVSQNIELENMPNSNVILVEDTLQSLQELAIHHRKKNDLKVIAITGSNGKTIVKEWLTKILSQKFKVIQSPNSFNSQIGVALSVLQINSSHEIGIFEAGISKADEMQNLAEIIQPHIGILTNIGDAHSIGFKSKTHKLQEKMRLFKACHTIISSADDPLINSELNKKFGAKMLTWGFDDSSNLRIMKAKEEGANTQVELRFQKSLKTLSIPFTNKAFLGNSMQLVACLYYLKFDFEEIQRAVASIDLLPNRLQIKDGDNNCILINDSYSTDLASMQLALEYQEQHNRGLKNCAILSDFDQQFNKEETYEALNELLLEKNILEVFLIAFERKHRPIFKSKIVHFFDSVAEFRSKFSFLGLNNRCILIKGARKYKLEEIFEDLSLMVHKTTLETDFSSLDHNLNVYKSYLSKETKIMAVIKADAYGSGSVPVSNFLQQKNIDFLAVAVIDEAIKIRKSGCSTPILILNIHASSFQKLWDYNLEPEIYSLELLDQILSFAQDKESPLNVHIKLDSGMHRLGIQKFEIEALIQKLKEQDELIVKSLFSHLAASEDEGFDTFTKGQIDLFSSMYDAISEGIKSKPLKHILNTGGIIRFSNYQFDMVRLGLGLYGIDETRKIQNKLEKVHSLKARVLQIKTLGKGESTGYGRAAIANKETKIAVISIGYADGLMRSVGNGQFAMRVNGQYCTTIGNVSMDVTMLNVTHVNEISAGDEVEVFGKFVSLEKLAASCGTISYEIISRIAPRIKRVYIYN